MKPVLVRSLQIQNAVATLPLKCNSLVEGELFFFKGWMDFTRKINL
jgi:hypothetical protein